ncbi:hypothetical protein GP486_001828 [Trichoglossum hirsutum]|uniref:Telomerase activating protein Est1 n=1 Tax=Trichoglossum hirsutum TaxID=265104 RepID=A0A9P8RSQ3_9PEZI|nr:hypothetical protein GP486_001828 [Trichoglossum hirsutum]
MAKAMATPAEQAWKFAQRAESELHAKLAEKDPLFKDIDYLIAQYRSACENAIFLDFELATTKNIEGRLWDAHGKINNRYRRLLKSFQIREGEGKKKPVEKRKMVKHYLEFIKSSTRHYRGYIQRLSSHFGGIPEVEEIAHRFKLDGLSADDPIQASPHLRRLVLLSCHQVLVHLGDLSRYRETELAATGNRNWGPATGYYDLATAIYPASGASHNQLAVIALSDGSHLRATYHLYRALSVDDAHPAAKGNLEIEFKKILTAWNKGNLKTNGTVQGGSAMTDLVGLFARLHAQCYKGLDFAEHEELENETLSQLALDLKERSVSESTLHKFVIINIAAQHFAGTKFQAFFYFLRLNVKTIFTLLQVLQPELEWLVIDDNSIGDDPQQYNGSEKVTAVTRRILPSLRNYSSWIVANSALLVAQVGDTSLNVQIKELWKIYANSLTLLAATFPAEDLPSVEYLLEEDEDTIGFNPLDVERVKRRYFKEDGRRKPRWHDHGVDRYHPNMETLARIRDLLTDGLELALDETAPIALIDGGTFTYQEEGLPSEMLASPIGRRASSPEIITGDTSDNSADSAGIDIYPPPNDYQTGRSIAASESISFSMSTSMNRMVDSIVGKDGETETPPPPTGECENHWADSPTTPIGGTMTATDLVSIVHNIGSGGRSYNNSQQSSQGTPRPSLPSIWNTAFAQPPSHSPVSPQRPETARQVSLQQANAQASSMSDPSSFFYPGTPTVGNGAAGDGTTYYQGASAFDMEMSSPYSYGYANRTWGSGVLAGTPPNGQGSFG